MNIGMLWLDKSPLEEAVKRAAEYYQAKYGEVANRCHVNHHTLQGTMLLDGIKLYPDRQIMKGNYWIGVE